MANPLDLLSGTPLASLLGGLGGGLPTDPTGLLSGLGGLPVNPTDLLGGLGGGLPLPTAAAADGGSASGSINDGNGNSASGEVSSNGGSGLPSLPGLGGVGGLPDLGGLGGGGLPGLPGGTSAEGGNGSVYGTSNGALGGLFFQAEQATYGIPGLGQNVSGITGSQVEGGGTQNIVLTQLYGTPAFGPVQSLIGGNSYGDELVLYDLATRPVALSEGTPLNGPTREIVTGSYAATTAFIGAYSGGLLSEDYLQYLVSQQGTLGSMANAAESALSNAPGTSMVFDGDNLNSTLDLVTNGTDQILYVDDIVAGVGGGDQLSNNLPFDNLLALAPSSAGVAAPVGDVLYPQVIQPLATAIQEVTIAGAITNGTFGKLI